jgi:hypothetical protein
MVAWFAIPLAVVVAGLWRLQPAPWALAISAILLCELGSLVEVVSGNPVIWFVAIEFAALAWRLPASLGLFKPSLFPFALVGVPNQAVVGRCWAAGPDVAALPSAEPHLGTRGPRHTRPGWSVLQQR